MIINLLQNIRVFNTLCFFLGILSFNIVQAQSVLSSGEIYKFTTNQDGIHRLTYDMLVNDFDLDLSSINSSDIKIYGNGGGLLSESVDDPKSQDLIENHIMVVDGNDNRIDPGDYILFYGQQADQKIWDSTKNQFTQPKHIYSDHVAYFLIINNTDGKRVQNNPAVMDPTYTSSTFDSHQRIENESVNLLHDFINGSGTGQNWYGDLFKGLRDRSYTLLLADVDLSEQGFLDIGFAGRGALTSEVSATVGNTTLSALIAGVPTNDPEGRYARHVTLDGFFDIPADQWNIEVHYPENSGGNEGWLDYIEVNYRQQLNWAEKTLIISDHRSLNHDVSSFSISNANTEILVWDITDPLRPTVVETDLSNGTLHFSYVSDELRQFIVFELSETLSPIAQGPIEHQNLQGTPDVDMILVYHPSLEDAAILLKEHREQHSNLEIAAVSIDQIYNEFSSGIPDVVAVRDYVKMVFDRSDRLKYLLLFGDASFDFKNLNGLATPSNLVPTYETKESLDPIRGFPSDDFFGLLTTGEGGNLRGALDISIGRLPARTESEAMAMVNKIIDYESNPSRLGDWINNLTFVADDEDFNIHLNQADQIAEQLIEDHPEINIDKIYLDAFQQVSTAGGEIYPDVQNAINNALTKGTSIINYMGHGGSTSLAQERVLTTNDVNGWTNADRLALFITATCSFTGYDDPNFVTAGERAILNPNGGAIALMTTVRAVYSSSNERLTKAVFDQLYEPVNGRTATFGEILQNAKNSNAADTLGINARKFLLIGDPSMTLIAPSYDAQITHINDKDVELSNLDTLKALEEVVIDGVITTSGGIKSDFNGSISVQIFDKPKSVSTLGQDPTSFEKTFKTRKNIISKGTATVIDGTFSYSFVVPQDIDYQLGLGKISMYAQNDLNEDASGYFDQIMIGGTSTTPIVDDLGPEIEIFMNDRNFVPGDNTDANPTLLVYLKDDYGINIVSNSIGHDITAVLDQNTSGTIILNEFYKAELDNNRAGTISFPLKALTEGEHSIDVKAWDIANNSSTASTHFIVASDQLSAIQQMLNYPNPMSDGTTFNIAHNISSGLLDIRIDIYGIDGRFVQSLQFESGSGNGLIEGLSWNGTNASGQQLERGIYMYKATILQTAFPDRDPIVSQLEKLVVMR